jgi:hypothetical protein
MAARQGTEQDAERKSRDVTHARVAPGQKRGQSVLRGSVERDDELAAGTRGFHLLVRTDDVP